MPGLGTRVINCPDVPKTSQDAGVSLPSMQGLVLGDLLSIFSAPRAYPSG